MINYILLSPILLYLFGFLLFVSWETATEHLKEAFLGLFFFILYLDALLRRLLFNFKVLCHRIWIEDLPLLWSSSGHLIHVRNYFIFYSSRLRSSWILVFLLLDLFVYYCFNLFLLLNLSLVSLSSSNLLLLELPRILLISVLIQVALLVLTWFIFPSLSHLNRFFLEGWPFLLRHLAVDECLNYQLVVTL